MITLTAEAVLEIKRLLAQENKPELCLRIGLRGDGGCGGAHQLGFDTARPEDTAQDVEGIKILIDPRSALYLDGARLEYVDSPQGRGFMFQSAKPLPCPGADSFEV
ncbi:MAG: iron-sulfur cluster assembly accessory protein [Elusimicrobiota bacterium]|jgi:iron-sulfur cluster assembly protein